MLADPTSATEFLAFLQAQQIDTVYLQLPGELLGAAAEFEPVRDAQRLRELMRRMHAIGVASLAARGKSAPA